MIIEVDLKFTSDKESTGGDSVRIMLSDFKTTRNPLGLNSLQLRFIHRGRLESRLLVENSMCGSENCRQATFLHYNACLQFHDNEGH